MASFRRAVTTVSRILNATHTTNRTFISPFLSSPIRTDAVSLYSTLNNCDSASVSIDLSNEESKRRLFNRLLYRSRQRGFLELDLVLGKWVEEHIHSMDENKIKALVDVLDMENPDLWKWLTGQEQPPDGVCQNPVS
ncbi:Succinate dehydrogenase assembly factor 2, mitochondrial [Linum perenne]